jgi:hypothetical protein
MVPDTNWNPFKLEIAETTANNYIYEVIVDDERIKVRVPKDKKSRIKVKRNKRSS